MGDDQPDAQQQAAELQAGKPAGAGEGEGAHRGHRQPGDQVDGGGVAAAGLQRDEPRGQGDPEPGQQPERAGGLGADAAQAGWHHVSGRVGRGRDHLGGCAVGFRTTGDWSSHDIVPFLFSCFVSGR
jgi:hypothetical protein